MARITIDAINVPASFVLLALLLGALAALKLVPVVLGDRRAGSVPWKVPAVAVVVGCRVTRQLAGCTDLDGSGGGLREALRRLQGVALICGGMSIHIEVIQTSKKAQ